MKDDEVRFAEAELLGEVRLIDLVPQLRACAGELELAARLYAKAARSATNVAERDHLTRQAARMRAGDAPSR